MGGFVGDLFGSNAADQAKKAQQQQAQELAKQKQAQEAKEAEMNRRKMADLRAQTGGGFGVQSGKPNALG